MIEIHSKYDNMHTNGIFNVLNCINNHVKFMHKLHVISVAMWRHLYTPRGACMCMCARV